MPRIEGQPINSAGTLQRAIGWGELRERYDVDGFTITIDDYDEAERLVAENPHLSFADDQPAEPDDEPARVTATTDGVEFDGEADGSLDYEERTALAEGLANEHWNTAVSTIESGEADAYLDILEQVDNRASVQNAIKERRSADE